MLMLTATAETKALSQMLDALTVNKFSTEMIEISKNAIRFENPVELIGILRFQPFFTHC